ncbi:MAG: serine hydrolase [Candidatus Eisenbacteria bacterium]|uniref:Serine hydrolase n=1 Tax=Eiseniibacteriota bacterium TaxID=2212470 RepID=A0A948W482_UNCEI|nr:serine hydrolase [Candidatus Eisenbacteria bacterium]MBU1949536.1 serine hydrolase [Candidatus Eisenbacteria bacterium]MBU2691927.1 serine hydrolase [Candidatus Eisenbacteria bacterium]
MTIPPCPLWRRRLGAAALRTALVFLGLSTLWTHAIAAELTGHWVGSIELPGMKLEIDIDFAGSPGAWTGDITIPAQGARDLPLTAITLDGEAVSFAIADIPGEPTFKGMLNIDESTIAGDFTQEGQTFPFKLASRQGRGAAALASLEGFDAVVEKGLSDLKVPGIAVAILVGGEPILMKGYGLRDVEGNLPVTTETLFAIGSSTKAFTAFVLGTLVDEGKLEWDKPVYDYIPDFRLKDMEIGSRVTPRDLVTHRCGLPRHDLVWYNNTELSRKELVGRLAALEANKDLRQSWQYNNLAYLTAGYLAEVLTGQSWEDCVRERILQPLEMNTTNFSVEASQKSADYALGYREDEGQILRMPFRPITNMGPAGSINSSIDEMSHWVSLQLSQGMYKDAPLIQQATLADLQTPQMVIAAPPDPRHPELPQTSYAMGWFVQPYRGHYRLQHGGNIDGFTAHVSFLPQDGIGCVFLANKNDATLPVLLERVALDRIFNLEGRDWIGEFLTLKTQEEQAGKEAEEKAELIRVKGTKPSHPLSDYAGEYENPGYGVIQVDLRDKNLAVVINHIANPLEHWHYDVFNCVKDASDPVFEETKIQFTMNFKGNVDGLRIALEPLVEEIIFHRRPDARLSDPAFLAHLAGSYTLVDETIRFELKGNGLILVVPGQPPYELIPDRGTEFNLKGISGYSVTFILDKDDRVEEVRFNQPNGVFSAKPAAKR